MSQVLSEKEEKYATLDRLILIEKIVKMRVLVVFLACAILTASAGHLELCGYTMGQLATVTSCVEHRSSHELRNGLDHLLHVYQCQSDVCAFNKICDEGDVPKPRREFWEISKKCEKQLPPDDVTV
ncbi:hypothetical protein HPB50_008934 [Hyalomma asiaticum]|uniref:Uncharacterized protein n=1 Tax=Hyalomma asiaticum TaxID=266040 RepID=A0ACB7THF5_HYAAI|nr:hypothetical protein HPB50_008934 [Hyalomma asiaticum]